MTLPRRGPLSAEERLKVNLGTMASGSGQGLTMNARPVRVTATPQVPPQPPAGGGVIGTGYYTDGTISTATTYQIDPSTYRAAMGDDSSITYDSGTPGLAMGDAMGWYQAFVSIAVDGLTAGQVARLTVQASGCIDAHYVFAAKFGLDYVRLTIATGPWQNTSAGTVLTAVLDNPSGGTIVAPSVMALTKISGPS